MLWKKVFFCEPLPTVEREGIISISYRTAALPLDMDLLIIFTSFGREWIFTEEAEFTQTDMM